METIESKVKALAKSWHEAGRELFKSMYPTVDYDSTHRAKTVTVRRKYIAIDAGTSGAFLVDRETGLVYPVKAYGVPNKRRPIGHIDSVSGATLDNHVRG